MTEHGPFLAALSTVKKLSRSIILFSATTACGDRVELRGFGAFSTRARNKRIGRNPRTGDEVAVSSRVAPYFKTGKALRERLKLLDRST